MIRIDRILCPVDFSDVSRHALKHVAAFARWYESKVAVLHVYSAPVPPVAVSQYPGNTPLLPPIQPDEVREQVRQFCAPLSTAGVSPAIVVEEGDPAKVITRMAGDAVPDLLIMGTHGRGGFQRRRGSRPAQPRAARFLLEEAWCTLDVDGDMLNNQAIIIPSVTNTF